MSASEGRRKFQFITEERRRSHDVVIYQEGTYDLFDTPVWCVQDVVAGTTQRFDNEQEAIDCFKRIKLHFKAARLM